MYLDLIDPLSSNSMSCHDRIMTHQNNVKARYHDHMYHVLTTILLNKDHMKD